MRRRPPFFLLAMHVLLALGLAACSLTERRTVEKPPAPASQPPPSEAVQEPGREETQENHAQDLSKIPVPGDKALRPSRKKDANGIKDLDDKKPAKTQRIQAHVASGEFAAALDLLDSKDQQLSCSKELAGLYRRAVNGAIDQGQSRLTANQPGKAGLLFRAALNNFPQGRGLAQELALTPGELEAKIALCAEKLMEQGLTVYREGHLNQAIKLWKKILAFAPHHEASQNAIRTAHIQLNNLKKMEDAPDAAKPH